eukprot:4719313-Prorocentrum_lima.AAC.1
MTSSLVGSEMCIRDRYWYNFEAGLNQASLLPSTRRKRHQTVLRCYEVMAVSYTHLTLPTICSV